MEKKKSVCSEFSDIRNVFNNVNITIARIKEILIFFLMIILIFCILPILPFVFLMALMLSTVKYIHLKTRNL